ncbi:hypothetical protein [Amycolatopsis sp. NPDC003731]
MSRATRPPGLPAVEGLRSLADLPLPRPYLDGMRVQFGFEDQVWTTPLFGSVHVGAVWYCLPAALLVKTPLGAPALWQTGAEVALPPGGQHRVGCPGRRGRRGFRAGPGARRRRAHELVDHCGGSPG